MEPGSFTIEGTRSSAAYVEPGASTCVTGDTLDWFMVSGGLALTAESKVEPDTSIYGHCPVKLNV
eukprot:9000203-Heterocapsa_arctica.AAC.1